MNRNIKKALMTLENNNISPHDIIVSMQFEQNIGDWIENDYVTSYYFDIRLRVGNHLEDKIKVGEAIYYLINDYSIINERFTDMLYQADNFSQDLVDAVTPILDNEGRLIDEYDSGRILYIDKFFIKPEYRNKGIGRLAFMYILDIFNLETGAISIIPAPTENDGETRINKDDARFNKELKAMTKFIKDLGFKEVDKTLRVWVKNPMYA